LVTSPGDQLLALGLGASAGAGALVWATGQLAGLAFGHTWLDLTPADVAHVLWNLRSIGATRPWPGRSTCAARCPVWPACTPRSPAWSAV
jgi:hypothetical protein